MNTSKQIYMAPLEGITKYVYRNAHNQIFGGVSKYFAPFIDARITRSLKSREIHDILPENNRNIVLVPQIMTNNAEAFLITANQLSALGYQELNLNLGCPSLTAVRKDRGAGFLRTPEKLELFFDDIFKDNSFASGKMKLSVKTRLGLHSPDEVYHLMNIYNKYPLCELIAHPRIQTDYYNNSPNLDAYEFMKRESKIPLIYNGDLNTVSDITTLTERFPEENTWMLGRGLIRNPALAREILTSSPLEQTKLKRDEFIAFHDAIYHGYQRLLCGEMPVLHKMKELWSYWISNFSEVKKEYKALNKSQNFKSYEKQVESVLIHFLSSSPLPSDICENDK